MSDDFSVVDKFFGESKDTKKFRLSDQFISTYAGKDPTFGFNGLGEVTYYRTFSRILENGKKERFIDTATRVVEGTYEIQRRYCQRNNLPFDHKKAQDSAQEMFERMWAFKWLPPGRGLWIMGTPFMWRSGGAALNNCGFVSTEDDFAADPSQPFAFAMDMLMLGVGIGFDTKGANKVKIKKPASKTSKYIVYDSREGWVEAFSDLVRSYTINTDLGHLVFDCSEIRPKGSPIKGFGGEASGPEGLMELLSSVDEFLAQRVKQKLSSVDITDLMNMVGKCVVAGNVRRSAEIAFGNPEDIEYISMKNPTKDLNSQEIQDYYNVTNKLYGASRYKAVVEDFNDTIFVKSEESKAKLPRVIEVFNAMNDRRWASNNSVLATVGMDYTNVGAMTAANGEPGYIWLDNMRDYGRMIDGRQPGIDGRVKGSNPCVEQSLESYELCVSGNTRIQTKHGAIKIIDLVGKISEVWNGKEWSKVEPKQTGSNRLLRRVTLSDGSYLDATPNHKWSVKNSAGKFVEIQTDQLMFGDELESFSLPNIDGVTAIPDILAKLAAGDSSVEKQVVDVYKQEIADQLLDSRKPLPECVMEMGSKNSAEFLASWARTNGSIVLRDSKVIINAPANRLHDLQLLARRARQNDVVVDLESKVLIINNICDKFCVMLGGKNNVEPSNNIQTVVSVDQIPGTHDTYCFNEQKRHKGVFNNVLTHQCNLVESFPHKHDNEEDYMRTIKYAYLYGKTVTLLPTHCDKTNTVMLRNRRIGLSQSGIVQAVEKFGRRRYLQNFCDAAYNEIRRWDRIYSEYFTCRESIKVTSIKPSGCRPWDALTTTDNGILTLEELFELSKHKNGDDWSDMDHEINVIQSKNITKECNGDVMVATKCVDRITKTYDNGISDTVIIKLSHNFELQSTPNHQWFVSARYDRTKKNRYVDVQEWKKASDLTENDILEVVPGIYNNNRHSELFELHDRAISMRGNIAEIKMPKYMNEDLAWLLGYMWGDGSQSYSKYRMRYSDENLFNLHKAQRIILDQFGLESSIKPASEGRNSYELSVGSKNLWHWLLINDILKIKSNADLIPKVIRSSSKSDILAFLAGLLDSDGCIGRRFNDQYCIISMAGGKFARHVQDIALSVGLVFSRSLNARGKNKQETKAMWSLSLMRSSLLPEFELFKKHCNKCVEKSDPSLPWTCELNNDVKILGKVKSVSDGPRVATFDIEVDDSHWYYAGAIKSHNTVSLIAGATPGIHFPEATSYWRRMRIAKNHSLVKILADAGYHIEPAVSDPENTVVVTFGVEDVGVKPINQVSIWEQMDNVAAIQHYWADNAVSVTIQFQPSEASDIPKILEHYEDRIKAVSFLPHFSHGYAQAPYEAAKKEDIVAYNKTLKPIDFSSLVDKETGEKYCDTDTCTL